MAPTFYGVLGVGPGADADAIERGYRERVTAVHPDVNDDPDADAQFKRLTTARETLLDADERARYDRLGHASYVRHHVSCSAWESTVSGQTPTADADADSTDENASSANEATRAGSSSDQRRHTNRSGTAGWSRTRDWNTGRRRSADEDATASSRTTSSGNRDRRSGTTAGSTRAGGSGGVNGRSRGANGRSGDASGEPATGSQTGEDTTSSGFSAGAGTTGSHRSTTGRSGDAGGGGESTYVSSSFWESQRVGQRFGPQSRTRDPTTVRLLRAVQSLGVWALIHVAFLAAAVGTSWYVYAVVLDASSTSLPLLVVLVGEVVLAAVLSSIHVATRVYR